MLSLNWIALHEVGLRGDFKKCNQWNVAKTKPAHEYVQEHVDAAEISTAELAKRTGWKELRVWRLLTGRTEISVEDLRTIARALDKPPEALLRGVSA